MSQTNTTISSSSITTPDPSASASALTALKRLGTSSKYQASILITLGAAVWLFFIYKSGDPNSHDKMMVIAKYVGLIWMTAIGATGLEDAADKYNPVDPSQTSTIASHSLLTGVIGEVFRQINKLSATPDVPMSSYDLPAKTSNPPMMKPPTQVSVVPGPIIPSKQDMIADLNKNRALLGLPPLGPDGIEVNKADKAEPGPF